MAWSTNKGPQHMHLGETSIPPPLEQLNEKLPPTKPTKNTIKQLYSLEVSTGQLITISILDSVIY